MIVIDQPHDLSADDEAALVAYVDGRLGPEERSSVETRAAADPSFAAALALQQEGRDAIAPRPRAPARRSRSAHAWKALRHRVAATGTAGRPHAPGSGGSDGRVRGWWPARSPR
jgi:anti-sigma factor RsiW